MSREKGNGDFVFILPVDRIPRRKRENGFVYEEVIREFLGSRSKYAEVSLANKKTATINFALRKHLKEMRARNLVNDKLYEKARKQIKAKSYRSLAHFKELIEK